MACVALLHSIVPGPQSTQPNTQRIRPLGFAAGSRYELNEEQGLWMANTPETMFPNWRSVSFPSKGPEP